jgi:hypothetical protein
MKKNLLVTLMAVAFMAPFTYSPTAEAGWKLKAMAAYCATNEKCKNTVDKAVIKIKEKCEETKCAEKIKGKMDSEWYSKYKEATSL